MAIDAAKETGSILDANFQDIEFVLLPEHSVLAPGTRVLFRIALTPIGLLAVEIVPADS